MRLFFLIGLTAFFSQVSAQVDSLSEINQLYADLSFLSHDSLEGRQTGTRGEIIAAEYIANRFKQLGLQKKGTFDSSYYQLFVKAASDNPHDGMAQGTAIEGRNVVGYIDNNANHTIIIGAHYDHLGWGSLGSLHVGEPMVHNGADDNASGVAALLFLANRLSERRMNSNFLFIAFSGEEMGLLGSNYFVNNAPIDLNEVNYMINMDMVGRLDVDRRLAIYGVGTSETFLPTINSIQEPAFQFALDSSGFGPSDHTSFYVNDIPVLHFFTGQHAQYHKPEDDVELINFEGLYDVSTFIERLIIAMNNEDKLTFSKTRDTQNEAQSFKVTLGIMPDYLFSGKGLRIDGAKEDRPAFKAGLIKGDVILKMGNIDINDIYAYMDALNAFEEGNTVNVIYLRNNRKRKTKVTF